MASMATSQDQFGQARQRMLTHDLKGRGIADPHVLRVIGAIPREEFVPQEYRPRAYADEPLPIGGDQTISQPYIVALMTELLKLNNRCDVLEVGTGSGYQTALLARLSRRVHTIEKLPDLSAAAQEVLRKLAIDNVAFRVGDGSCGWPEPRSFDRIILTAAVPSIPKPLADQLAERGRLVAPVGSVTVQQLILAEKVSGELIETEVCGCRFVRLIGACGFKEQG
jgi:protein-L-isoaspartate(D-aspartate) O-methyltransferase